MPCGDRHAAGRVSAAGESRGGGLPGCRRVAGCRQADVAEAGLGPVPLFPRVIFPPVLLLPVRAFLVLQLGQVLGRNDARHWPGVPRQHDPRTLRLEVGRQVRRDVPVVLRLGVAGVGLGAGRVARLLLATVPDQVVDERRIGVVAAVVPRIDPDDDARQRQRAWVFRRARGRRPARDGAGSDDRAEHGDQRDRHTPLAHRVSIPVVQTTAIQPRARSSRD